MLFEFLHQFDDLVCIRAPVRKITDLYEVSVFGNPVTAAIDKARIS